MIDVNKERKEKGTERMTDAKKATETGSEEVPGDYWKLHPFTREDNPTGMVEESSFAVLFPKYREQYLRSNWGLVTRALKGVGVMCELDLREGTMTVRTTSRTYDPYAIIKARDVIKMLSRGVPAPQAVRALEDDVFCEVIKISGLVRNRDKFVRRRERLVGPDGATLKAIEMLTGCYMLVQGKTVAVMGPARGIETVRQIVVDCMNNIHPVYAIKTLMIKRELAKDPKLANESWDRFLPKFKKNAVKPPKKPKKDKTKKKPYTPFPPEQPMSKMDMEIESGEYFMSAGRKRARAEEERKQQQAAYRRKQQAERAKLYEAPKEAVAPAERAEHRTTVGSVEELKQHLIDSVKKQQAATAKKVNATDYIDQPQAKRPRKQ